MCDNTQGPLLSKGDYQSLGIDDLNNSKPILINEQKIPWHMVTSYLKLVEWIWEMKVTEDWDRKLRPR